MSVEERENIDRGLPTLRNRNEKVVTKMPPLSEAAIHGDLNTIDQLLKDENLNVNELDEESMSALHWAAAYGEAHIVKKLLEHPKINAGITNKRGSTPLHQAVLGGAHEVLRVLLTDERVRNEVDVSNMWGETALILAATRGDSKAAAILLIEGKANKETKDKWGKSAIDVAEDYGEKSTAELLLNYSPGKTLDELIIEKPKTTPQTTVVPQKKVLSKLLEAPLDEEKALKWIAEPEMDINGADYLKWTAIHKCAAWEKPVVLKALLDHPHIQTHVRGMDGDTILHTAASSGATRCVNILIEDNRIQIDGTNDLGVTSLMLAAGSGNTDVVNALLGKGADPNKATPQGKTAWNFAKESQADWIATLLWPLMSCDVQSSSSSLFSPPPPRPSRPTGKLSAKLVAIQDAVRNKKD